MVMNHPNTAVVNGKIYILGDLGGGASWQAFRNVYRYDPSVDV